MDTDLRVGLPVFYVQPTGPKTVQHTPAIVIIPGKATAPNGMSIGAAKLSVFTANGVLSNVDAIQDEVAQQPGTFHVTPPSVIQAAPAGTVLAVA